MKISPPVVPKQPLLKRKGLQKVAVLFVGALAGAAVTAQIAPAPTQTSTEAPATDGATGSATAPARSGSNTAETAGMAPADAKGKGSGPPPPPPLITDATPPVPVPAVPPVPGIQADSEAGTDGWRWTVRVDLFLHEAPADTLARRLSADGLAATVRKASGSGGRVWSMVTVGDYATGGDAEAAANALAGRYDHPLIAVPLAPEAKKSKGISAQTTK